MKSLAVLLLLVALPAVAQQTEITAFSTNGVLTWTNETSNAYCGVEWSVNLHDTWVGLGRDWWQMQPTGAVVTTQFPIELLESFADDMSRTWLGYADRFQAHFFRIVASTNLLCGQVFTNSIRIVNSSGTSLTNIVLNAVPTKDSPVIVTNIPSLAPSANTPYIPVAGCGMTLGNMDFADVSRPNVTNVPPGWFIRWRQDNTNRHCGTFLMPFGQQDKKLTVTVYSNEVTTYYEWLGPGGTVPY